ncbi:MAG: T9SS C-terminal target domain-containing protein [Bacteroidetes bacterium]|nr:MAG: T9SS C-terminal target domain-containing protein [Bacteroidota bacterium]
MDLNGNFLWSERIGGSKQDEGVDLGVDLDGNVFVTGIFNGVADFNPASTQNFFLESEGQTDAFVLKVNGSGDFLWARRLGGMGADRGTDIRVHPSGKTLLTGCYEGDVNFGSLITPYVLLGMGDLDIFLASLEADGEILWAGGIGGSGEDCGMAVAFTQNYDWLLTGYFASTANFSFSGPPNFISAQGQTDIFVMKGTGFEASIEGTTFPYLSAHTASLSSGQALDMEGLHFSPGGAVRIWLSGPEGFAFDDSLSAQSDGSFTYTYPFPAAAAAGIYQILAVDVLTGRYAPMQRVHMQGMGPSPQHLRLSAPTALGKKRVAQDIDIQWTDRLVKSPSYPMTGIKRHYSYDVAYSTDDGVSWTFHEQISGMDDIDKQINLATVITLNQPGSDYRIRITDTYIPAYQDISERFEVELPPPGNIQAELAWDLSFPEPIRRPLGVAADGVARLFLKVSKKNPDLGPEIAQVSVSLGDGGINSSPETLGKLMKATYTQIYHSEANMASATSAAHGDADNGTYWFWYVAPDDFVGNDPAFEDRGERLVTATISVQYGDGTSEQIQQDLVVVRPPLMLVHGLGGDRTTWVDLPLGNGTFLVSDMRFKESWFLDLEDPGGAFYQNARSLTIGKSTEDFDFFDSFQGLIFSLRSKGYASNQVDYVGHSMGGVVLREVFENHDDLFFRINSAAQRPYKNYERGYVNKMITVGSPHLGSPFADMAVRYVPQLHILPRWGLHRAYRARPEAFIFSLFRPNSHFGTVPTWEASDAVKDLQMTQISFDETPGRAHLIASDLFPRFNMMLPYQVPQEAINGISLIREHIDPVDFFMKVALAIEPDLQFVADIKELYEISGAGSMNSLQKTLGFIELFANAYNVANFLPESDVVVSLESQLAGQPKPQTANDPTPSPYTLTEGLFHTFRSPKETDNLQVGERLNLLLNAPTQSAWFDNIPATTNKRPFASPLAPLPNPRTLSFVEDSNRVQLRHPLDSLVVSVGDMLALEIAMGDTANLLNVEVQFQDETYIISEIDTLIKLNIPVNGDFLDEERVYVEAIYDYSDSVQFVYDVVEVAVETTSPFLGFSADPTILYVQKGRIRHPAYTAFYEDFVTVTANFSERIQAVVDDPGIAAFDTLTKGFWGLSEGETFAVVSYRNALDTVYLSVTPAPDTTTAIQDFLPEPGASDPFQLANFPNPFASETAISYFLPGMGRTSVTLTDLHGRTVQVLVDAETQAAGWHEERITLDPGIPAGVYLCRLQWGDRTAVRKMVVVK